MTINQKREIFRLAAVLYADNNYEVNPKTIHRKIIESVFLDNNNEAISSHSIIEFIEKDYGFIFDFEEVNDILVKNAETHFLLGKNSNEDLVASLTPQRFTLINSKLNSNNIDFFIQEFLVLNQELISSLDGKAIIYKFLYGVYSTNISSFSKLIDYKIELENAINQDEGFNPVEKEIINAFLRWENDGKNKAIFDISSYALEYCLITNKDSGNTFHLKNLKNKDFYLDTNILFRAIGINGENRKERTMTFLQKFKEAGERLIISKFTEQEYKSTVKYYISQISKKPLKKIDPRVFIKFKKDSEFFDYYHRWRMGRTNDDIKYFEAHLLSEYEGFKTRFNVTEEYNIGFDERNDKEIEALSELARDIFSHKNKESLYNGRFETAETDAKNIYMIRKKRNGQFRNIFETKIFFISSDQGLRRWDFKQSESTPSVILPSQWMSILLRYINRTNDDFKSFVSFLNLPQNESNITNEKLQLILIGISEITGDVEQQSAIVETMISEKFKGILDKSYSDEEIIEQSKQFAKSKLETELIAAKEETILLKESIDAHKQGAAAAIHDVEIEQQLDRQKSKNIELENLKLKNILMKKHVAKQMFVWWLIAIVLTILGLLLVLFYLLIFLPDSRFNYPYKIANFINTLPDDSAQKNLAWSIYILPAGLLFGIWKLIKNRFSLNAGKEKRIEYENKWLAKYTLN